MNKNKEFSFVTSREEASCHHYHRNKTHKKKKRRTLHLKCGIGLNAQIDSISDTCTCELIFCDCCFIVYRTIPRADVSEVNENSAYGKIRRTSGHNNNIINSNRAETLVGHGIPSCGGLAIIAKSTYLDEVSPC